MQVRFDWVTGRKGLRFYDDAGNLVIFAEEGGDVGIGNSLPLAKLHVGAGADAPSTSSPVAYLASEAATALAVRDTLNNIEAFLQAGTSRVTFGAITNHDLRIQTNNADRLTVLAAGNIGVGNTAPGAALHVGAGADAPTIAATTIYAAREEATAIVTRDTLNNIETFMYAGSSLGLVGTSTDHPLRLRTNNTDRVHIDATGVGIGNTAPRVPLDVGNSADTPIQTLSEILIMGQRAGRARLAMRNTTDDVEVQVTAGTSGGNFGTASNHPILIVVNNAEVSRWGTDGNFGLATGASPTISDGVGIDVNGKILRLRTSKTPATAGATGNAGEICWDSSYIYLCIAANTWRRVSHATW